MARNRRFPEAVHDDGRRTAKAAIDHGQVTSPDQNVLAFGRPHPSAIGTSSGGDPLLSSGVFAGVIIGVALSLGWLVFISASPEMPQLGRLPGTQVFRSVEEYPDSETYPGLLAMRFDAGLFFASSDALEDRLRELAQDADTPYDTIIISFEGVDFIDSQGSEKLAEILDLAETYGAEIRLAHVKPSVLSLLRRDGVIDTLGEDNVYGNVYEAADDRIQGRNPR